MNKKFKVGPYTLTADQYYGRELIKGSLFLPQLKTIPTGFNPMVEHDLKMLKVTTLPAGFNPTVGWCLFLNGVTTVPAGFNPRVGWSLFLNGVTTLPAGFNPTVGCNLYLNRVTSVPEGFNPTVGDSLFLNGVTTLPAGFNPTVGYDLHLESVTELPAGFNPTVGRSLFLNSVTTFPEGFNKSDYENKRFGLMNWQDGKYIKADGIFAEVVKHKGNVWHLKKIGSDKIFYMVTDGNGKYAHGDTLEAAKSDLVYKVNGDASIEDYRGISADKVLSFEESVKFYRVVTGACSWGTRNFVESIRRVKWNRAARLYGI